LQLLVEGSPAVDSQDRVSMIDLTIRFDAVIYQILVGEPEAALHTLEPLDLSQFVHAYGEHDDYWALTYLAIGDQERASERAPARLRRARGNRPPTPREQ
jgi:hypothetical protein